MNTRINRPAPLQVGISDVGRWRKEDEVHLPTETRAHPLFLPETQALDRILRRETLDERLARDVVPDDITPELMEPRVLSETRKRLAERLFETGVLARGAAKEAILEGADLLDQEVEMDADIQEALALLLRG